MEIITRHYLIANVSERFKSQYRNKDWDTVVSWSSSALTYRQTYDKLVSAKSEQDVKDAIGVTGWVKNTCYECGEDKDVVVMLGELPDYESNTTQVCLSCIKRLVTYLESNGY